MQCKIFLLFSSKYSVSQSPRPGTIYPCSFKRSSIFAV
ncbi:hypothetical protein EVA_16964 [gut metagenome]|uniref:Uncharacterized protein n=1 Tax=gut metagenome TaxID=749906 RepID=J9G5Z8_9ZZZZ